MSQEQDRLELTAVAMEAESLYYWYPRHGNNMLRSSWEKSQGQSRTSARSWGSILSLKNHAVPSNRQTVVQNLQYSLVSSLAIMFPFQMIFKSLLFQLYPQD